MVLFAAPDHPLARRKAGVAFAELEGELIVLKEEGSSTHALVRELFERRGLSPNVLVETGNLEFIKDMVEKGEGVSFLVRSAIAPVSPVRPSFSRSTVIRAARAPPARRSSVALILKALLDHEVMAKAWF